MVNGDEFLDLGPTTDPRIVEGRASLEMLGPDDFCYVRVDTEDGNMTWSSPVWGHGIE